MTENRHPLAVLIDAVRRRHLTQVVIEQTVVALGAAFAGAVLLLLFGTQILNWYWIAALFAASLGIGLWRTRQRIPTRYRLAQIVDSRLQLQDTLSTALFYESGERSADADLIHYQHRRAEDLAGRLDAATVFPLHVPKALYAAAGIALVAFGMFAIRYGVTRSLDLKPSLIKIAFDTFWAQDDRARADNRNPVQRKIEEQLKKLGINLGASDTDARQRESTPESAMNAVDAPDASNAESGDNAQANTKTVAANDHQPGEGESGDKSERASGSEDPNGNNDDGAAEKGQGAAQNGKDPNQKNGDNQAGDNSSMMDRMRDAMSNLLNKLKMQPKSSDTQQMAKDSKSAGKGQQPASQKGSPSPGKSQSSGADSQEQQGQQQGQGDASQSAKGKSGDKGDQQPSNDAKSGIGKDDGDKSTREAEQLAAMGKISEILGKRAQNLSGDLMVEVAGGHQQLKTAYSGAKGKHAEAGGEITRDEVPLIYREYVQQYFEQIRKTPPVAGLKMKSADNSTGKKTGKVTE